MKTTRSRLFNIEFWTSPLHYKGYKMGKYKLVLYGINATDDIKIYRLDDVVYLKNNAAGLSVRLCK
jgi:hypothetical protein